MAGLFSLCLGHAFGQEVNNEPVAIVELGAAPGRSLTDHTFSFGPTAAVEVTPIEKWLELEAGVTASLAHRSTEWSTDLLFKKPRTLSSKVEFMAGIGPEWIHTRESGTARNSVGAEAVLDFMFWPDRKHKFGWYLEPAYDYNFGRGHEQSIGISIGLLIAIKKKLDAFPLDCVQFLDSISGSKPFAFQANSFQQVLPLLGPKCRAPAQSLLPAGFWHRISIHAGEMSRPPQSRLPRTSGDFQSQAQPTGFQPVVV